MAVQFGNLCRVLWLAVAMQGAIAATGGGVGGKVGPSDCRPRDADSTCAAAVAGATVTPPTGIPDGLLYDGPLGGVATLGYAYWGFDFVADQTGTPSPVRPDQFINRSGVPVSITLSFNVPTSPGCLKDCLPGVEFEVGAGWYKVDPPLVVGGGHVSVSQTFGPGLGYGWMIGLWQATNARLTVTVPKGAMTTLQEVGLPSSPAIADPVAAVVGVCYCWDGSQAACSDGGRYSNGLLGPWYQNQDNYIRAGVFNGCPPER